MLNDISGTASSSCNLNFHLTSSLSQTRLKSYLKPTPTQTPTTASTTKPTTTNAPDLQPLTALIEGEKFRNHKDLDLLNSITTNGADSLSWKFFEQVDSVDHQLRNDESSSSLLLNGGILPASSSLNLKEATDPHDVTSSNMSATLGTQHIRNFNCLNSQPHTVTASTNRKSNGFAINGTLLQQSTETLSQTNATSTSTAATTPAATTNTAPLNTEIYNTLAVGDIRPLFQQQQQEQQTGSTFAFTSPTSTFKRKKQQQLRKQKQEDDKGKDKDKDKDKDNDNNKNKELQQSLYLNNNNLHKKGVNSDGFYATCERPVGANEEVINREPDDFSNTTSSTGSNTILLRQSDLIQQQQQQQQQFQQSQRYSNANNQKAVINTNSGVIVTDTVVTFGSTSALSAIIAGGNGTTLTGNSNGTTSAIHSIRTHTLPLITKSSCAGSASAITATVSSASKLPSTYIGGGIVDLVHDTKYASSSASSIIPKSLLKSKTNSRGLSTSNTNNANTYAGGGNLSYSHKSTRQANNHHTVKMQASSSGGSGTTTTAKGFSNSSLVDDIEMHLGLIGWRKKCLYTLLVLLMLLIIINLGLTLWILKVMEFTTEGMGQLKIVPGGIQLTGQALIMDMLRASSIRSRHGQPISIESSRNFSINTRGTDGQLENHLFLGHDKLECITTGFHINDTNGKNLFSVNRNEVTIGAHALRIEGEGGAIFRESIQTPHVRAEPGRELRLESPTRQLEMTAAKDINLQSRAGGIEITALEDVKLTALDGSLRFESSKIFMPNLRTVQMPLPGTPPSREHLHRVFQLCACSNGKLFLASPHSICAGDDSTVCR